ncbi:MAG: response regulator [Pirellulaceae bacterium]|nr:response regulator [Planctomycetales bacterium]MCA9165304.1 response regulator [Planctomycetales bacterium]MCA9210024.1 response regulator [Planctomycetales bacterium]MCA9227512.1 response regulator [Planctomycetales bacterium]
MSSLNRDTAVILIIDSDPITLMGMAAVLNMAGHECHCARDAEAALKAMRTLSLDLVVCDIDLKYGSGFALCQELKQQSNMADVPFMFVTSADDPDIVDRCREAGASYYLRKPFDPDVLMDIVDKALWMPHLVQNRMNLRGPIRSANHAIHR